jgi:deoxyadenosine/deoxycytidine kinase
VFVAIEGPTGAGKTTLATRLAPALGAAAVLDPFDLNPFLPQMLACGRPGGGLALRAELTFAGLRIAQLREIGASLAAGDRVITDWALLKQQVFAATTLSPGDCERVAATIAVRADSLPVPDVLVGLSATAEVLRGRIARRGRTMEATLSAGFLRQLSAAFDAACLQWPGPLIRVDAAAFDVFSDRPPGYESIGRVASAGVTLVSPGDLIAIDAPHADGHLLTETAAVAGLLPPGADPEQAVFFVLARVALGGVHDAALALGETVVITGLGTVGLLAAQQARHAGARVIGVDPYPLRLAAAEAHGITTVPAGLGADVAAQVRELTGPPARTRPSRRPGHTPGCTRPSAACARAGGRPRSPHITATSPGCGWARSTTGTGSRSSPR